jgi:hypothetical protein
MRTLLLATATLALAACSDRPLPFPNGLGGTDAAARDQSIGGDLPIPDLAAAVVDAAAQPDLVTTQACTIDSDCAPGNHCCNTLCVDESSDPGNCGGCGLACTGSSRCCSSQCDDVTIDVQNCGTCGHVCSGQNATEGCAASACKIQSCSVGFADCNQQAADGCEVKIAADPKNCGGCGNICTLANATASCVGSACAIASCNAGFADCNGSAVDGCEADLNSDPNNCAKCGRVCAGTCVAGGCQAATSKRIFVSSVLYTGNLGGVLGADQKCQALADGALLGGTWKCWISDDNGNTPSVRMTHFPGAYTLVDGMTPVANSWAGLTSGSLLNPIIMTEKRTNPPFGTTSCLGGGFATVWTDSSPTGLEMFAGDTCSNWTSTTGMSAWGDAYDWTGAWSFFCNGGSCASTSAIYCVEQ